MVSRPDWYLREWLRVLGKRQSDVVRDLGWNKAKISLLSNGKQEWYRTDLFELSEYLNLRPWELLMPPDDAMALRQLRMDAVRIAHSRDLQDQAEALPLKKVS